MVSRFTQGVKKQLVTLKAGYFIDARVWENDTLRTMDIFENVPPLFEPGQDLYESLHPADAMEAPYDAFPRYNPGIPRAVALLARALSILRAIPA